MKNLGSLLSLALFFLSFLSNLVIIRMVPNDIVHQYLGFYNVVGFISAVTVFYLYLRSDFVWLIRLTGAMVVLAFLIGGLIFDSFLISIIFYPLLLIFNDYLITQGVGGRGVYVYRMFLIFSVLPFLIFPEKFNEIFIARVFVLMSIAAFLVLSLSKIVVLGVKSPTKYLLINCAAYYAPLYLLVNLSLSPVALKVWYVFSQAGLVLYLKYMDFLLRGGRRVVNLVGVGILLISMVVPLIPMGFYPNFFALLVYYFGLGGLLVARKYIQG